MAKKINHLQQKIMRRVYYAYALRLATHPIALHVLLLLLSAYALVSLVSVSSIVRNMLSVRLGDLASYVAHAFMHANVLTLIAIGVIFFTLISLRINIRMVRSSRMETAFGM